MEDRGRTSILVIDPDAGVRALIRALLEREGYHTDSAADVEDALELCRAGEHAAVIVDPRILGGETLIDALHRPGDGAKLIVVTTPDSSGLPYRCNPGVHAVLLKPFLIDELAAVVESCCDGAG
jgi:DNA-binding NtrC family response regulator